MRVGIITSVVEIGMFGSACVDVIGMVGETGVGIAQACRNNASVIKDKKVFFIKSHPEQMAASIRHRIPRENYTHDNQELP